MKTAILFSLGFIIAVSITTGFMVSRTQDMSTRISAKDLPSYGLIIIKPSDREFDEKSTGLLKHLAVDDREMAKPFTAIFKNTSDRAIVAHAIIWECEDVNGGKQSYNKIYANSEAFTDKDEYLEALRRTNLDQTIQPNSERLISISPLMNQGGGGITSRQKSLSRGANMEGADALRTDKKTESTQKFNSELVNNCANVTIVIDGAFFDDGTFVGPNKLKLFEQVQTQVEAKRAVRNSIADKLLSGKSKQEIFRELEDEVNSNPANPAASALTTKTTPEKQYEYFRKLYAKMFLGLRKVQGEDKVLASVLEAKNKSHPQLHKVE